MALFHPLACAFTLVTLATAGCGGAGGEAAPAPDAPDEEASTQSPAPPASQDVDLGRLGFNEGDMDRAAVRVVEFSDFGCIFCARFHMDDYPELHDEFIVSGDVVWKYVPITIGGFPNGEEAAIAGECAGAQDRFAPMRDLLFQRRDEWMAETEGVAELFRRYASDTGLDLEAWDACLAGDEAVERLAESNRVAVTIGVRGTPTFLVQGVPVQGAPPLESFQSALRDMIAEARAGAGPRRESAPRP
jgi:protein-disulfide isomerase